MISNQGETHISHHSCALSSNVLFNYKNFSFDAETNFMKRKVNDILFNSYTGYLRVNYNMILNQQYFIEPNFMYMFFDGDNDPQTGKTFILG